MKDFNAAVDYNAATDCLWAVYKKDTHTVVSLSLSQLREQDESGAPHPSMIMRPVCQADEDCILVQHLQTDTLMPYENTLDIVTATITRKPKILVNLSATEAKVGDTVIADIQIVNYEGKTSSAQYPCLIRIDSREGILAFDKQTIEFPSDQMFRIRAGSPGKSVIMVRDVMYDYIGALPEMTFLPADLF